MNSTRLSQRITLCSFLALSAVEGAAALVAVFATPSLEKNAALLGYSRERWILAAFMLLLTAALAYTCWFATTRGAQPILTWLSRILETEDRLTGWLLALLGAAAALGLVMIFCTDPLPETWELYLIKEMPAALRAVDWVRAVVNRTWYALLWALALWLQAWVVIIILFWKRLKELWHNGAVYRSLLAAAIILAAVFQWIVLRFQLKTFLVINGWKWYFHDQPAGQQPFWFLLMFALTLGAATWILRKPQSIRRNLILLVVLGYGLQIGFGFIQGKGFESIRLKYADSVFSAYAHEAAKSPPLLASLRQYETLNKSSYLDTKPPGVLLTYVVWEKLANPGQTDLPPEVRFVRLTTFGAYLFPLIAACAVLALYALARRLMQPPADALLPGMLYIVCPNVLLIPMFMDQTLYPLLFVLALLLVQIALERQSFPLMFAAGLAAYLILYLSFSLLPMLPLAAAWIVIRTLQHSGWRGWLTAAKQLAAFVAGLLIGWVVLRLLLNYDILHRYQVAFAQHRRIKEFTPGWQRLWQAVQLNTAEISTWTGFPIILLALSRLGRAGVALWRRRSTSLDGFSIAFFLTYAALNVFGQTFGEVQRLWLFMVPLFCLLASDEARSLFKRKETGMLLVMVLQLILTFLTFEFQDFYG